MLKCRFKGRECKNKYLTPQNLCDASIGISELNNISKKCKHSLYKEECKQYQEEQKIKKWQIK